MKGERMPVTNGRNDFRPDVPIDLETIHGTDYTRPVKFDIREPMPNDIARRTGLDDGADHLKAPTVKDTQYTTDYPDWGTVPQMKSITPTVPKTLASGMPFYGRQTYKDYGNFDKTGRPDKLNPERGQKNPLGVDLPFIGDTTYGNFYRPFKVGKGDKGPKNDDNEVAPRMGLYDTTYQEYDGAMNKKGNEVDRNCCSVTAPGKDNIVNDTASKLLTSNDPLLNSIANDAIIRSRVENAY